MNHLDTYHVYIKAVWHDTKLGNAFICIDSESDVAEVKQKFASSYLAPVGGEMYIDLPQLDEIIQYTFVDYAEFVKRFSNNQ